MNHPFIRRLAGTAGVAIIALGALALGGTDPAAAAPPPPPTVGPFLVQAGGTEARITFTTSEPTVVTVARAPKEAPVGRQASVPVQGAGFLPAGGPGAAAFLPPAAPAGLPQQADWLYLTSHEIKLIGLASNTTYTVTVSARTRDNRTATTQTSFTTLKKRVRITLESIDIQDDGDGWLSGDGEPLWTVSLGWTDKAPAIYGCYPIGVPRYDYTSICDHGEFGAGVVTPRNSDGRALTYVFSQENFDRFPDMVSLSVTVDEEDNAYADTFGLVRLAECIASGGCIVGDEAPTVWRAPQGVETVRETLTMRADEPGTGFKSVLTFRMEVLHNDAPYPASGRNRPHSTWR